MKTRRQTRLLEESTGAGEQNSESRSSTEREENETLDSSRDGPPQRKKRAPGGPSRPHKVKAPKRIKGKLSGVLALPIEVFMEIMLYLALPDVLSLSRANKFFRQMLMTRSAATLEVWQTAVKNVPGLPPCPKDLCEPQYATLIYSKHCSMCGASVVRPMDPYLNIRLCKDCTEIQSHPSSSGIQVGRMKTSRYGMRTCLISDVEEVEGWVDGQNPIPVEEMESRVDTRFDAILDRGEYAVTMEDFLRDMAKTRTREIDELKEQRRQDVKRRLGEAGWKEPDWIFPEFVARKWAPLVEAPQALTERAWQKLYPSLVPYLETNRRSHTERSRIVRKGKRVRRLRRLLLAIRNENNLLEIDGEELPSEENGISNAAMEATTATANSPPTSDEEIDSALEDDGEYGSENPSLSAPTISTISIRMPFPPMVDLLEWPIISELLNTDTDADTMQERFEEIKAEIEDQIRSWRLAVEKELVGILKVGAAHDTKSSNSQSKEQGMELDSETPQLQLETEIPPESPFMDLLTTTTRLLLRADSVFRASEDTVAPMPLYFPELFHILQDRPDGYCSYDFRKLVGYERPMHGYTWDPSEVVYYPEGTTAAKALLRQLGREDAAQFELEALGARFTCGPCGDKWLRTWNEMVQHYAEAIVHANTAAKAKSSVKKQVKYNDVHYLDLDPKTKGKRKPIVVLHGVEEARALSLKRRKGESLMKCNSCEQLGVDFRSPRDVMLKHIRTVHLIKAPKAEHYERWSNLKAHIIVDDPMGAISDSTEATDQEMVKDIVANHSNYGTEESNGVGDQEAASGSSAGIEKVTIAAPPTNERSATGPPPRKKRAPAKTLERSNVKQKNRSKGKLSEVFSLPIEVFVEIIRYLALPDVLSLSRASKFFHQMLMTRSAAVLGVWRAAVANVPGLPPCPKDLCEPQYATLIYSKHCTLCGAGVVRPMDPYLNVRLCKDCCEVHVAHIEEMERVALRPLVHQSEITRKKSSRWGMKTCLVRDKEDVEDWIESIQLETDDGSVSEGQQAQITERIDAREERLKYAPQMERYLREMAETRAREIDQLKDQRRQELKRRMREAGWGEADWTFPFFVARKWATLVEAPQPLTERAWQKLYPIMVPYLEKNRISHVKRSKLVNEAQRHRRMRRLLLAIKNKNTMLQIDRGALQAMKEETETSSSPADIDVADDSNNINDLPTNDAETDGTEDEDDTLSQSSEYSIPTTLSDLIINMPFPPMVDVLEWPIISDLLETDTDADTMEAEFEESRVKIEASIRSWGEEVQDELVGVLKSGATNSGNSSDNNEENHNMQPFAEEPLLELRVQLPPERSSVESLTPSTRLLLRADSVFRIPSDNPGPMPLYFPELFLVLHDKTHGYFGFDSTIFDSINQPKLGNPWKLEDVAYYPEGVTAAKALLNQLGRPNAAQFELQALGPRFTCGSCGDKWVQHYAEAISHARMATEAKGSVKKKVKYDNQHRPEPNNQSKGKHKPLIILHSAEEVKELSSKYRILQLFVDCDLCDQLGIKFQAPRGIMLKHIRAVHSIKTPKAEHYKRTSGYQKHPQIRDRTGGGVQLGAFWDACLLVGP
ncbi:unnamed protein product [Rhizoctonia solani]|uniref:F-box domain-containing protein n=1 Tax=Rhizoctonia solani TaxID=456999 RepID=A0A8H3H823_9AGAM|nr:unnamed protein product [Rhizoctonia solani]